jgi:hypothetical protein
MSVQSHLGTGAQRSPGQPDHAPRVGTPKRFYTTLSDRQTVFN